uniref:ATP synthase complex subunit 8 n=1 Tax=Stenosialis australiensis TaxID=1821769 RepID=A0A1S5QYL0_9NEOP|nr:ATP synthase F0 subunit 8 [Stenosialis australiensis]
MPQMAPLYWFLLFLYFFIIFILFNIMNYYNFNSLSPSKLSFSSENLSMNWKW